ncbi:MAG: hypothetical protein EZS28_051111, partial [Streblomastix strix]
MKGSYLSKQEVIIEEAFPNPDDEDVIKDKRRFNQATYDKDEAESQNKERELSLKERIVRFGQTEKSFKDDGIDDEIF